MLNEGIFNLQRADSLIFFLQDKELRYRFIYNHFPSLQEEVMIAVEVLVAMQGHLINVACKFLFF